MAKKQNKNGKFLEIIFLKTTDYFFLNNKIAKDFFKEIKCWKIFSKNGKTFQNWQRSQRKKIT